MIYLKRNFAFLCDPIVEISNFLGGEFRQLQAGIQATQCLVKGMKIAVASLELLKKII